MDPRAALALVPLVTVGTLSLSVLAPPPAAAASRCAGVTITAHRGAHDARHTENTLRSTRQAVSQGADALEGDMRLTRDGVWVMMHDRSVRRTTTGRGQVARMSYAQVRRLRTSDGVRGGVPTVDAVLSALDSRPSMRLQLEIKPTTVGTAALARLFGTFDRHRLRDRLTVISFDAGVLRTVRRLHPGWRTALVADRQVDPARARSAGDTVSVERRVLTAAYARSLRAAGLALWAWTPDDAGQVERALARGVTSIVTDRVAAVQRYCG